MPTPEADNLPAPEAPADLAPDAQLTTSEPLPTKPLPIAKQLPVIIFLNGPPGSGKEALTTALEDLDAGITWLSLGDRVHYALSGLFLGMDDAAELPEIVHPDHDDDPTVYFQNGGARSTGFTNRGMRHIFATNLRMVFGPELFGQIAQNFAVSALDTYETVVVSGVRTNGDIAPLMRATPKDRTLLVRLYRDGADFATHEGDYLNPHDVDSPAYGMPSIDIHAETLEAALAQLLPVLGIDE